MEKILYYKRVQGRSHGRLTVISYLRVNPDGSVNCIDTTRLKISNLKSFGGLPMRLYPSTKKQWERAKDKIYKTLESI